VKIEMIFNLEKMTKEEFQTLPEVKGTNEERERRINELCQNIQFYLDAFEKSCPFNFEQLRLHIQTINLRYSLGSVSDALEDNDFIKCLWNTLRARGMASRAATLLPLGEFRKILLENKEQISKWENTKIDDKNISVENTAESLWKLIDNVRVSKARNPIVSGSKTFHHLLPELVPPIDREHTRPFFMFWGQYFQNEPRKVFSYIWKKSALIARKVDLRQ
jgi:hypothetical protein